MTLKFFKWFYHYEKSTLYFEILGHKILNNNICNNEFRMWLYITKQITWIKFKHLNEKKKKLKTKGNLDFGLLPI
jgi:hypothetical protein